MTAYRIGRVLTELGRPSESPHWFASAYRLNPRSAMIATGHAQSLLEQKQVDAAAIVLDVLLWRTPDYGPAKRLLAMLRP